MNLKEKVIYAMVATPIIPLILLEKYSDFIFEMSGSANNLVDLYLEVLKDSKGVIDEKYKEVMK